MSENTQKRPEEVLLEKFTAHLKLERRLSVYTVRNYTHAVSFFLCMAQRECRLEW